MKELAARLRALLRPAGCVLGKTLTVGNIAFDTIQPRGQGRRPAQSAIAPRELETFSSLLMRRAGQVLSRRGHRRSGSMGFTDDVQPNAVEAVISRLRKRLSGHNHSLPRSIPCAASAIC